MTVRGVKDVWSAPNVGVRRRAWERRRLGPVLSLLLLLLESRGGSSSLADREERASESDRVLALRDANGDVEAADLRDRCRSRGAGVFAGVGSVGRGPLAVDIANVPVGSRNVVTSTRSSRTDAANVRTSVVSSATADRSACRPALLGDASESPVAVATAAGSGRFGAPKGGGGVVSAGTDPSAVRRASVPAS